MTGVFAINVMNTILDMTSAHVDGVIKFKGRKYNMKCQTCGKEMEGQWKTPGQWVKVCFQCWDTGKISDSAPADIKRQMQAYIKNRNEN